MIIKLIQSIAVAHQRSMYFDSKVCKPQVNGEFNANFLHSDDLGIISMFHLYYSAYKSDQNGVCGDTGFKQPKQINYQ